MKHLLPNFYYFTYLKLVSLEVDENTLDSGHQNHNSGKTLFTNNRQATWCNEKNCHIFCHSFCIIYTKLSVVRYTPTFCHNFLQKNCGTNYMFLNTLVILHKILLHDHLVHDNCCPQNLNEHLLKVQRLPKNHHESNNTPQQQMNKEKIGFNTDNRTSFWNSIRVTIHSSSLFQSKKKLKIP